MSLTSLKCPRCGCQTLAAFLIGGSGIDTKTYIELVCEHCDQPGNALQFVVDLTPDFDRATIGDLTCFGD
jgi:hypothetical protein